MQPAPSEPGVEQTSLRRAIRRLNRTGAPRLAIPADRQVFQDAEQMPSPGRHFAEHEIQPQPESKQRTIKGRGAARELRRDIVREVFPDMAGRLDPWIANKTVIVEDELKI